MKVTAALVAPADPGGDAGNDAERDLGGDQRQRLFGAASEDEGIAALETQDAPAGARQINQPCRNIGLFRRRFPAPLAGEFEDRSCSRKAKDPRVDQRVMDHRIGQSQRMQREER